MFGTVVAKSAGIDAGLLVATSLALLMTQMDILGRSTTTVFQHLAEGALAQNNIKKMELWTIMGTVPWILSRAIPVFFGMLLIDNVNKLADFANSVQWISKGLSVVGKCLPAVGFALLLSYMDLKKFWPFLILGFVLYAYMGVGTIGLALVGLAAGALYTGIGTEGGAE
jgi:PTS system mannose-specific IIC component